jgi:hypothetical protein
MAMMQPRARPGGMGSSHFHLPSQFLMGLIFLVFGTLLLLKKIGKDFIPFIPEVVFIYICAIGSIIGGFYLIVTQIWRPRIYL